MGRFVHLYVPDMNAIVFLWKNSRYIHHYTIHGAYGQLALGEESF